MSSSQQKKSLYLVLGLMILVLLGLLWRAGMLFQGPGGINGEAGRMGAETQTNLPGSAVVIKKISAPSSGEADVAAEKTATVTRKALPPAPPPPPASEPAPAPLPSAPVPTTVGQEKAQEPHAPQTAPPVTATPPASQAPRDVPEKPIESKPAKTPPPAAPAAPVSAKKPEPTKTVAKMQKSSPGVYPFSLLLVSHQIQENALEMQPDFERKGLAPYIVYTDLGKKGKWWRTLLGAYKNYKEALQAIKDLKIKDVVPVKTPFANLLGDYPSEKQAAGAAPQFTSKGLFPYVAKGAGSAARLLVGAYPTQAEAERLQRELEGMGISAHAIRR